MKRLLSSRGTAILELAIGLAVLVPVTVGAVQFTVAFLQLSQLEAAVHHAARVAATLPWNSLETEPTPEFRRRVENEVLYLSPEEAPQPIISGLRREHVRIHAVLERGVPVRITVSISGFPMWLPGGNGVLEGRPSETFPLFGWGKTPSH